MATGNNIQISITGDTSGFDSSIRKTESEINKLGNTVSKSGANASKGFSGMANGISAMASAAKSFLLLGIVSAIVNIGKTAVKEAAKLEQMQVAFEVMLGSADKAKKMISELQKVAASTPYGQTELISATQTMLGFGIAADKVIPYVKQLGDIASGNKDRFKSLALAFSQAQAAGKLMGQDLLQMINAGFNPLKEISRTTGKSISQLKDEMAKGQITAQMLSGAFKSATSSGGAFYQMSIKQSKTLSGLFSTMRDNTLMALAALGQKLMPTMKLFLTSVGNMMRGNSLLGKSFQLLAGIIIKSMQALLVVINAISVAFDFIQKKSSEKSIQMLKELREIAVAQLKNASGARAATIMGDIADLDKKLLQLTKSKTDATNGLNKSILNLKGSWKLLFDQNKKENKKLQTDLDKVKKKMPVAGTTSGKGKKMKDLSQSEYLSYIGKRNEAELAKEKEKYDKLVKTHKLTAEQKKKIDEAYQKKVADLQKSQTVKSINNVLEGTGRVASAFGELSSIITMAYQNQMTAIDMQLNKRLEAIDIEEQRYLESMGLKEETELEKGEAELSMLEAQMAAQTDARKKAALQQVIDAKRNEVDVLRAQKKFEDQRTKLNEDAEKKKRELIRKTAIIQKAANIAETIQNTAVAVMKAWSQTGIFGGPAASAVIGALGAAKLAIIAQQPIPEAATGAFIPGSQDGTLMRVAERGRAEAVMPLEDNNIMSKVGESIATALSTSGGSVGGAPLNIYIGNDVFYSGMYDASKRGEIIIDERAVVSR